MDASEIFSKRTQCKGSCVSQRKMKIHFPITDGRIKFTGRDQELRTSTLIRDHPIRGESQRYFLEESEGSSSFPYAGEAMVHVRKLHIPPSR